MLKSMTGFGVAEAESHGYKISVELRSVNHRYLDVHVRCPAKFLPWETRVRGMVRGTVARGKVDVFLAVREWGKTGASIRVNRDILSSFLAEASRVREESGLPLEVSFRDLLGVPDLFVFAQEGADPAEEHWEVAEEAVRTAAPASARSRASMSRASWSSSTAST